MSDPPSFTGSSKIAKALEVSGFIHLEKWRSDCSAEEIVREIGEPHSFGRETAVHTIVPKIEDKPNTYSGLYGLDAFPFHSDMAHWRAPPRYLFLRCQIGHDDVATPILDGKEIATAIGNNTLARALVKPRRPVKGTTPLLTLWTPARTNQSSLLRWDERYIVPASDAGAEGMRLMRAAIATAKPQAIALSRAGDTLLIDNWRMLHGRSAVPASHVNRVIERAYLRSVH